MDPEKWLAGYNSQLASAAAGARAASENLRQVGGSATSPRGEVSVRVGASGSLEDIRLTPAARALEAEQLARLILETARQAQRIAGAQVVDIMTEYVGAGPALELVKQNVPLVQAPIPAPVDDDSYANPEIFQ